METNAAPPSTSAPRNLKRIATFLLNMPSVDGRHFSPAATAERLPDRQADAVADKADAAVGHRGVDAARVIAPRRGEHRPVRTPGLRARHSFRRRVAAAPDPIRGRGIRPRLGAE